MNLELALTAAQWVRSSHSDANGGQCVEYSRSFTPSGIIPVRDGKRPQGPVLLFPVADWSSFISAVRRGEFTT